MCYDNGMSIPPSGYQPNYGATPPPRSSGVSGWKIAGFGCLALFLLAALGVVLLGRAVKDQVSHPSRSSPIGIGIMAGKAGMDGVRLQQAIVAYHQEKGKYPKTLLDLVSDNRIDGKMLHNDLDADPNPGHVSWRYTPPAEGAPGDTLILEEPYQVTFGGSTQPGNIAIRLDGRSQTNTAPQSRRTPVGQTP